MTLEATEDRDPKQARHNLFALLLDVISYWVGAAFTDPMTVLLLLLHGLGATATTIGLCIALRFAAQYGVQVFAAYIIHGKPKQKPFLVWSVGLSRLPMVALPFFIYRADRPGGAAVALWVTIGVLALVGLGEGLGGVPWTEIVARTFDTRTRGRFFTSAQASAGVLNIIIAGLIVTHLLALPYPLNYTLLVGMSALMFQISTIGLLLIKEPTAPLSCVQTERRPSLREYLAELPQMIREDATFGRLVVIQLFVNSGWAAYPSYVTFAKQHFHLADDWAGTYQLLQAVSVALLMPIWAYLSEKRSPAAAVRGVALGCMIAPVVALTVGTISPWHFGMVFLLTGGTLYAGGIWVVMQHFLLSHTEENERPKYVALLNLLNLPSALFPLLGSLLVQNDRFIMIGRSPVLFIVTAITVSVGFFLSLRLTLTDDDDMAGNAAAPGGTHAPHNPNASYPSVGPSLVVVADGRSSLSDAAAAEGGARTS
jgi:hypothetical protein